MMIMKRPQEISTDACTAFTKPDQFSVPLRKPIRTAPKAPTDAASFGLKIPA